MGDVLCSTGVDQATLGLRMRRQRRHNTHESVRMGARRIVRQLENCESGSTAEMSVQTLGEFAFAVTDALQLLERQEALDDSGALRRLVEVQARFLKYSRVQTLCSSILGSLRVDENFGGLKIGVKLCVETIVGSMRMHCKDRRVVREGLRALCSLSRLEEVRFQMLGESNGIETAINGMEAHAADVAVQCEGTRFLSYACVESESNKTCITRHGGTQRVVAAMCEHVDSNRLQLFGCKLVRNITVQREDLVEACEESGCVEAIIDALQRHGEARGVAIQSLTALQHVLCREETGQRVLQHQGAEWAVMEAARRHFACVQIVTLSLAIAGRIASAGGAVASKRLVRAGAMAVALDGMERFVKRRGVLFFGARLVRRLLETGDGMEEVNVWGGVPRLLDILYCTAATPVSEEETFGGYTDLFIDT